VEDAGQRLNRESGGAHWGAAGRPASQLLEWLAAIQGLLQQRAPVGHPPESPVGGRGSLSAVSGGLAAE
jgi:hypothetical protein